MMLVNGLKASPRAFMSTRSTKLILAFCFYRTIYMSSRIDFTKNNLGVLKTRSQAYCPVPCTWQEETKQVEQKWYSSTLANIECGNNGTLNCVDEAQEGEKDGINLLAKCFESRSQIGVSARVESHNSAVAETEKAVKEIQEEIFTMVFDSIVNFVETAAAQAGALIPTAVLLTGVREVPFKKS